jgi:hypothetical protein
MSVAALSNQVTGEASEHDIIDFPPTAGAEVDHVLTPAKWSAIECPQTSQTVWVLAMALFVKLRYSTYQSRC